MLEIICIFVVMFGLLLFVTVVTGFARLLVGLFAAVPWWVWLLLFGFIVGSLNR